MASSRCLLLILVAMVPASMASYRDYLLRTNNVGNPSFCHGLDCPQYKFIRKEEGKFEERLYSASNWVSTDVLGLEYDKATSAGFMTLFDYIDGENERQEHVPMTAPVIVRVIPGQGPACETNFTVSFYIPPAKAADPPKPTNPDVYFSTLPEMTAYIIEYGGYNNMEKTLEHAEQLGIYLTDEGITFVTDYYYTAGYDSPFRPLGRHNEIWFMGTPSRNEVD